MIIGVGSFMHEHREQRQILQVGLYEAPEIYQDHSLYQAPSKSLYLIFVFANFYCFSLRGCLRAHKTQVHPWWQLFPGDKASFAVGSACYV